MPHPPRVRFGGELDNSGFIRALMQTHRNKDIPDVHQHPLAAVLSRAMGHTRTLLHVTTGELLDSALAALSKSMARLDPNHINEAERRLIMLRAFSTQTKDGKTGWQIFEALADRFKVGETSIFSGTFFRPCTYTNLKSIMKASQTKDLEGTKAILNSLCDAGLASKDQYDKGVDYWRLEEPASTVLVKGNPFDKDLVTPQDWQQLIQLDIDVVDAQIKALKSEFQGIEDEFSAMQGKLNALKGRGQNVFRNAQAAFEQLKSLRERGASDILFKRKEAEVADLTRLAEQIQAEIQVEERAQERTAKTFETGRNRLQARCRTLEKQRLQLLEAQAIVRSNKMADMINRLDAGEKASGKDNFSHRVAMLLAQAQVQSAEDEETLAQAQLAADADKVLESLDLEERLALLGQKQASGHSPGSLSAGGFTGLDTAVGPSVSVRTRESD